MSEISMIGLDLAKEVFQVHGVDNAGRRLLRRQLKRREVLRFFAGLKPCLVAMEAYAATFRDCALAQAQPRHLLTRKKAPKPKTRLIP